MNAEILSLLRARIAADPRPLPELHRAAAAAGSTWTAEQVALLLDCLPDLVREGDGYLSPDAAVADPVTQALLSLAGHTPLPAVALVTRLPQGVVASAMKLCDIARRHPDLQLLPGNRIRHR